ncbi:hypothetical protein NF212_11805 [Parasalinivibrio latis]|uniref:hypothetical protein n=1 Tax=Parasalinivibrio latis TaxID=2952610 RepID=UPI0030E3D743
MKIEENKPTQVRPWRTENKARPDQRKASVSPDQEEQQPVQDEKKRKKNPKQILDIYI